MPSSRYQTGKKVALQLSENLTQIRILMAESLDLTLREFELGNGQRAATLYIDGLVDMETAAELPTNGAMIITLQLAKGLEFDHVIVPDASARVFPADDRVAKNRLYTTVSRATRSVQILCRGELTPLLKK